jgi:hypothetical protein
LPGLVDPLNRAASGDHCGRCADAGSAEAAIDMHGTAVSELVRYVTAAKKLLGTTPLQTSRLPGRKFGRLATDQTVVSQRARWRPTNSTPETAPASPLASTTRLNSRSHSKQVNVCCSYSRAWSAAGARFEPSSPSCNRVAPSVRFQGRPRGKRGSTLPASLTSLARSTSD